MLVMVTESRSLGDVKRNVAEPAGQREKKHRDARAAGCLLQLSVKQGSA